MFLYTKNENIKELLTEKGYTPIDRVNSNSTLYGFYNDGEGFNKEEYESIAPFIVTSNQYFC